MNGMSPLLLIPILSIAIVLSLSISNVNAVTAVSNTFSTEVPDNWIYRENFPYNNNIVLTPNEFAELLIPDNVSYPILGLQQSGIMVELGPDRNFPIKNPPLETYVKQILSLANTSASRYENTTVGGERAIKVYINGKDQASTRATPNIKSSAETISYFVMHHDQPYYLNYIADAKDYQKYLPQFEQMVKTFKFLE